MEKAVQDIKNFLEYEDISFQQSSRDENTEIFFFGARSGDNQMKFVFYVENDTDVVQFRLWDILDDKQKEILKNDTKKYIEFMEYLLYKNYQYKLGKWTMDPKDLETNFTISHQEDISDGKGIDKSLLKRVKMILFQSGDEMMTEIKSIINGGSTSGSGSSSGSMDDLLKALKSNGI